MQHSVRVADLLRALDARLQLQLHAGEAGLERALLDETVDPTNDIVAGPLNFIHPNRIQVLGKTEQAYLNNPERNRELALATLFAKPTRAVFLVDGVQPDESMLEHAGNSDIPLFSSPLSDTVVLDNLQHFAAIYLSDTTTLHGVFLEVLGMGVLLTGDPAVGKSELALDLIARGSRLVADDATEFTRIAPDVVSGTCPQLLREFLEVRGLGVLNIRAMFGDSSIKHTKYLRLIVHLKRMNDKELNVMERLTPMQNMREVVGVMIPQVTIPVAPGRNLGVLVEAAVRNHLLRLKGYDATEVLIERQQRALRENE